MAIVISKVITYGYLEFETFSSGVITDYCERAINRLVEQFKNKPRLKSLICSLIEPIQTLEYTYQDLRTKRFLETAVGEQLDGIGEIVGLERQGLTDSEYRTAIQFQVSVNSSNGEPEILIAVVKNLTGAEVVRVIELSPATIILESDGNVIPVNLIQLIEQSAPAGVRIQYTTTFGQEDPFVFDSDGVEDIPGAEGYAEPTEVDSGGQMAERIE